MKKKYLICGAGGFIGGHLVNDLMKSGNEVICADIKPKEGHCSKKFTSKCVAEFAERLFTFWDSNKNDRILMPHFI